MAPTTDDEADPDGDRLGPDGNDETEGQGPEDAQQRERWGILAAIGAASLAARAASGVAEVVGSSAPARAADHAARRLSDPLVRQGDEVRDRIESEAGPAAQQALKQVTPGVVEAVDINAVLAAIDVNALVDRLDVDRLVDRIDVGAVVAKVDVGELVAQVDVDAIVSRVDIDAIVSRVDIDAIVARVDIDALLARLDLTAVLDRIDLDHLLASIDLGAVLARIALNALLDSVDHIALLGSVVLDALLEGVDLNELLAGLDIDALMSKTELGGIIARSTSGVASEALDVVRSQGVGMDGFINRLVNRALGRDPAELPPGPPLLIDGRRALPPAPGEPGGADDAHPDEAAPAKVTT